MVIAMKNLKNHPKFIVSLFVAGFLIAFSQLALAKPEVIGRVLIATQGVTAQQPEGGIRQLARKAEIYLGDTLTTPEGGKAQIRLNDGELISLTPATQLILEDFSFNPQASKNTSVKNLVTGGLRSISGVVGGEGYQVKTRAGTIGIRGTAYEAFTQQGNNLYVRMQRGDVSVKNNYGEVLVGVNQPLAAARILSPSSKPEAIGFSALPEFFNHSFNAEATLSLAEEEPSQTLPTGEANNLAEANTSVSQQELTNTEINSQPNRSGASEINLTNEYNLLAEITTKADQDSGRKQLEDISLQPNLPNGRFRGYVLQETYNLEAGETLYKNATGIIEAAYFKGAELTQDASYSFFGFLLGEAASLDGSAANPPASQPNTLQQLLNTPNINNLAFGGSGDFSYPPGLSESELEDLEGFNLYTVYDFLDLGKPATLQGEIYYGYHIEKLGTGSAPSYKFSTFAFSEDILLIEEVNNLPLNQEFTYALRNSTNTGLSNTSELKVNFATKQVTADITHNLIQGAYLGAGSIASFYTNGIDLINSSQTGLTGNLKGQLAGTDARGAITIYELNSGTPDFKAGIGIFTR